MNLDQIRAIFGTLVAFLVLGLQTYDAQVFQNFSEGKIDSADREYFGRVDASGANGIFELVTPAQVETKGIKNFDKNKLLEGQHFAFDQFKFAFGNTCDGQITSTGVIAAPTVYNVFYSSDTFSKNELLKTNRSAVAGASEAWGVPVQRVPNALLNASLRITQNGKTLFYGSVKRVMNDCERNGGYMLLKKPQIILANEEFSVNIEFATSGAAMPASSFVEYSFLGVGLSKKAA